MRGAVLCCALAVEATADPLRLRGDALATTASPAGLVVLRGEGEVHGVTAEAMVWFGATDTGAVGDALVVALIAETSERRAQLRVGRLVATLGALPPLHLDGAAGRLRFGATMAEAILGIPVVPRLGARAWDWAAGSRVSRQIGEWGGVGVAFMERRREGSVDARWFGADASASWRPIDLATRLVIDATAPGVADAQLTLARRFQKWRFEGTAQHRVAAMLLPQTSLFSVLGDVAADRISGTVRWRAAPRLDVNAEVGARAVDTTVGAEGSLRATLRLDDRGRGMLQTEVRRQHAADGGWTGARAVLRVPLSMAWTISTELEVARADVDRGRSTWWPWSVTALGWRDDAWDFSVGVEGGSTPTYRWRVDALAQIGWRWALARRSP